MGTWGPNIHPPYDHKHAKVSSGTGSKDRHQNIPSSSILAAAAFSSSTDRTTSSGCSLFCPRRPSSTLHSHCTLEPVRNKVLKTVPMTAGCALACRQLEHS